LRTAGSAVNAFSGLDLRAIGVNLAPLLAPGLIDEAQLRLEEADQAGLDIIIWGDDNYPERLNEIVDPAPVLWTRGRLLPGDKYAVALVGSRTASTGGLQAARRLGREGAAKGLTIVSGLAKGVDTQAHRGALEAGGRTVAVMGCGLNHIYPKENAALYEEIAQSGALVSEFRPETRPLPVLFPRRNRVIAGLSLAVVIVEARERSGALITARLALEMNREVMALPGPAGAGFTKGGHGLIKDGAAMVENIDEVLKEIRPRLLEGLEAKPDRAKLSALEPLEEVLGTPENSRSSDSETEATRLKGEKRPAKPAIRIAPPADQSPAPPPDSPEGRVLAALIAGPLDADSLGRRAGLPAAECSVVLLQMELAGQIVRLVSGLFEKAN
ncbi:DNA-processing protein DprA, partial [Deltaproteobacteria bacterium OttesenSCG-928-M10]|nr:DNA-processing protein DprA [Deltaproteobacteria bacterium OttesenSCG-928-M10]